MTGKTITMMKSSNPAESGSQPSTAAVRATTAVKAPAGIAVKATLERNPRRSLGSKPRVVKDGRPGGRSRRAPVCPPVRLLA